MQQLFRRLRRTFSKPILFGICGAIGCLLAALLLGEPLLLLTKVPVSSPISQPQAIVMLIDSSGSMDGEKITEVKRAARSFVQRQDLQKNQIAVLGFGSKVQIGTPLTSDLKTLEEAIENLNDGGGTLMNLALAEAVEQLKTTNLNKNILLFTDGEPSSPQETIAVASQVQKEKITLITVGTGDANADFLSQLTGNPKLVFYVDTGNFEQAFQKAENAIYNRQLVEGGDSTGEYGLVYSILRVGTWTGILALGVCLALIIGQNYTLHRRPLTLREGLIGVVGGLIAGLVAGSLAQLIFGLLPNTPLMAMAGRVTGWSILGLLVGGGMSFLVPNLSTKRGLLGGVIGGIIGGICFLVIYGVLGEVTARLIGAGVIGFFIGLMIALIEQMTRKAWIIVEWTPNEKTTLTVGSEPIVLGSSENAHIYLSKAEGFSPVTAKIYQEGQKYLIEYDLQYGQAKGMKVLKHELTDGAKRKFGQIILETRINTETPRLAKIQ